MIIVALILGIAVAGFVALMVLGALIALAKLFLRLMIAGAAGVISALVLPLDANEYWVPFAIFMLVLLFTGQSEAGSKGEVQGSASVTLPQPKPSPPPEEHWTAFRRLATWREARRLDAARATCARYMLLAQSQEDPMAQLPLRIGRHLPEQVADCLRHCQTATSDEKRTLVSRTLASIEGVAAQAEKRRGELARQAQMIFEAREAHLARDD